MLQISILFACLKNQECSNNTISLVSEQAFQHSITLS